MANTAAPASSPELLHGTIKKVTSADTFVLQYFKNKVPHERVVHLANLVAPKVAIYTNDMNQHDEPMGWECREVLRKEFIKTEVTAEVEHKAAKSVFAYIFKGHSTEGESLNEMAVARGFASVKEVNKKNERYERLKELQEQARTAKLGIWSDNKSTKVREIEWAVKDVAGFVDSYKGKPLDAIVEGIHPSAAGIRAYVELGGVYYYLTVMLAGIRGPSDESGIRPRAIYFLECGLLHASGIQLQLDSAGSNGQLFGRVKHPDFDIVKLVLINGLAQTQDWSLLSMEPEYVEELRAAESTAKQERKGIWKNYKETVKADRSQSTAKVVEVIAADMLVIKDSSNNLKKIFISSIRPPRKETQVAYAPGKLTMAQKMFQQPLLFEAREFLRKALIGKNVQVQTDFIQPKSDLYPEKVCCTVTIGGKNIAEQLVAKGLASVIRYRQDNDQRSPYYLELQKAENTAQKSGVGLYAKKDPEPMKVVDLQGEPIKSKQYFSSLQRSNPLEGIVEFVSSGSRLRVYCAKHACIFPFLLNGIQCPRASRLDQNGQSRIGGDPFGDDALMFTKDQCLQHEINMEVESQDKNGAMIGKATIAGKNLAVELVKVGLATVHHYSAEKLHYYKDLCNAEELAKKERLRLWKNYVEEVKEETEELIEEAREDQKSERTVDFKTVHVSEITSEVTKFYVQYTNDREKFLEMHDKLQEELKNTSIAGPFKRGERAAAKFSDGNWYRVKIEKLSPKKADLLYVDYGNRGECPPNQLQRLPAFCATTPDVAHLVNLAFVKMPKDEEEVLAARKVFAKNVKGEVKMNVEYSIQGEQYVTLHVDDSDVGRELIADGYAFFEPRRGERYAEICKEYQEAMDKAKNEHLNLWEYGDARDDEDDRS